MQQIYHLFINDVFDEKRFFRATLKMLTQMLAGGSEANDFFETAEPLELSSTPTSNADLAERVG